jgi:hypothetical protein
MKDSGKDVVYSRGRILKVRVWRFGAQTPRVTVHEYHLIEGPRKITAVHIGLKVRAKVAHISQSRPDYGTYKTVKARL